MGRLLITGRIVVAKDGDVVGGGVLVNGDKIEAIMTDVPSEGEFERIDFSGSSILPGLIDVHIHGVNGFDVMDGSVEALSGISRYLATKGVTGFLATTLTGSRDNIVKACSACVEGLRKGLPGAELLGVHLEGPFLNSAYRGAQLEKWIRPADIEEFQQYLGLLGSNLRKITLAPEMDPDFLLIKAAAAVGVSVSAGHSGLTYQQAQAAIDAGVRHATHLFNAMAPLHHREPGLPAAVLSDPRVAVELIADGHHVHPGMIKLVFQVKEQRRVVLITDAMRATGLPDGDYDLGGLIAHVRDGVAKTAAGGMAGSTLHLLDAVRNTIAWTGLSLSEAWQLASGNAAADIGLEERKGSLSQGFDADLVVMDEEWRILLTMVGGRIIAG